MGLLDLFTGAASKKAAKANAAAIQIGQQQSSDALGTARDNALGLLGTGTGAAGSGGGNALSALQGGYGQARSDIGAGYDAAAPALAKLGSAYDPMVQQGAGAYSALNDAIGVNGADGNARATSAFQAGPGYQYAMDQALEAVQRTAAARGGLAGGNATADILKTATGLADQSWQQHIANLQNGAGYYQTGLAGQAQGLGAQASSAIGKGTALGALGSGLGQNSANLYNQGANIQNAFGTNMSNVFQNSVNQQVGNNNARAQADNAAGANILGGLFGAAQLATGNFGSAAGRAAGSGSSPTGGANFSPFGSGLLGSIGNIFG